MKKIFFFIFVHSISYAYPLKIEKKIQFAGMQLFLTTKAKNIIQNEIKLLTKNAVYFKQLVDKANLYFPLIETILKKNKIPEDIKYLVIQESALKAEAISKSDAVGFWQFKDFTAKEVGLILNENIDQRMDILASTQGAAQYFNTSQKQFINWCYSIIFLYDR